MTSLKVALVQKSAAPNQRKENHRRMLQFIQEAAAMGADLVLFPEMWSNGYAPPFPEAFDEPLHTNFEQERQAWFADAVEIDSDDVKEVQNAAVQSHIGVCATFLCRHEGKFQNTAVLIDRSGHILLNYAKVHTCDFSLEGLLSHGTEFFVCDFEGVKIGVMICYDREFPESARVLMLKGAEIILVPNACGMNPARLNQLNARAFENMVGIAMANYPGKGWGGSCAFSPVVFDENGNNVDNVLFQADDVSEKIYLVEFDIEKIRDYRKRETWGNAYRKPEAYTDLVSFTVQESFIRT